MTLLMAMEKTWSRLKRTRYLNRSLQRPQQSFSTWQTLSVRTKLWQHSSLKCKRSLPSLLMHRLHWLWHAGAGKSLMKKACPSSTNKGVLWLKIQSLRIIMSYLSPSCPRPHRCWKRQKKTNRLKKRNRIVATLLQSIKYMTKRQTKLGARGSTSWLGGSISIITSSPRICP